MAMSYPAESGAEVVNSGVFDSKTWPCNQWVIVFKPKLRPRMRLICFPYAGGDANVFRNWSVAMPEEVEVIGVQYPGRGCNQPVTPISNCDELTSQLTVALAPFLGIAFAFLGHSNAALIGFEVARSLSAGAKSRMRHLYISARSAPHVLNHRNGISGLDDKSFVHAIREMGCTPPQVLYDPWLVQKLLPRLRADIALGETYVCRPSVPLECEVSVLQGEDDELLDNKSTKRWCELTTGHVRQFSVPGGHFFLNTKYSQGRGAGDRSRTDN